jgi:hypothetical protein
VVFLILILAIGAPALVVVAKTLVLLLAVASNSLSQVFGFWLRFSIYISLLAASALFSSFVTPRLIPMLPDFRTQGDGGVGLAYNTLSVAGLYTCLMIAALSLAVLLIVLLVHRQDSDVGDRFDGSATQDHSGNG